MGGALSYAASVEGALERVPLSSVASSATLASSVDMSPRPPIAFASGRPARIAPLSSAGNSLSRLNLSVGSHDGGDVVPGNSGAQGAAVTGGMYASQRHALSTPTLAQQAPGLAGGGVIPSEHQQQGIAGRGSDASARGSRHPPPPAAAGRGVSSAASQAKLGSSPSLIDLIKRGDVPAGWGPSVNYYSQPSPHARLTASASTSSASAVGKDADVTASSQSRGVGKRSGLAAAGIQSLEGASASGSAILPTGNFNGRAAAQARLQAFQK